ncbi:hypothetical protein [Deinococcus puniceus]|uniref:Uncharacterized protein n=1 Tax=Deinococcus puniceus TaxID=1182568 RepID=A0A172T6D4_9DEIO|nr:hypothetical protein [Deinococcus puniceus]ANE42514.1 hypothetical protein SU48_00630 [Deinococcus puniceus]
MGLDVIIVVERRRTDGRWERAEELVPNDYRSWLAEDYPDLGISQADLLHNTWTFYPRDQWLMNVEWPTRRSVPDDMSREAREALIFFTTDKKADQMLLLRDLEETDWEACWDGWRWTHIDDEKKQEWLGYLLYVRSAVLDKLRPLGGLDDVRLIFGYNV